jgi:hypothetical protein
VKRTELLAHRETWWLFRQPPDQGESVLSLLLPTFIKLVDDLIALPEMADAEDILATVGRSFNDINLYEDQILTFEREAILDTIYSIGSIVGLNAASEYAERWRGDW